LIKGKSNQERGLLMLPAGMGSPESRVIDEKATNLYINRSDYAEYVEAVFKLGDRFLLARASRFGRSAADQDDLRQDTWARFIESDPDLRQFPLCGWLYRVMSNINIDRIRDGQRQPQTKPLNEGYGGGSFAMHPAKTNEWFLKRVVHDAIAKLHPVAHEALLLSVQEGCSQEEIANRLKLPVSTIQYHVSVGKKILLKDPQIIELVRELARKKRKECA
jgi:RNA polymerase sigma factor (sigma-70 family)